MSDSGPCTIIIPARLKSSRLPGKVLLEAGGKPLVRHTYEAALRCDSAIRVVVASHEWSVLDAVPTESREHTSPAPTSGSARAREVVERYLETIFADPEHVIVVWQADEPCVQAEYVDAAVLMVRERRCEVATLLATFSEDTQWYENENFSIVKCAASNGRCWWFSRSLMSGSWRHIGVYAFRRDALIDAPRMSHYAEHENLEQLAWIEGGYNISYVEHPPILPGIDTREDYERWRKFVEAGAK